MKTWEFNRYHSYTSHPNLSDQEYRAIAASNYNNFPDRIKLPSGETLDLRDLESENITRSGYAIKRTKCGEIRSRVEHEASPNYYQMNGNGSCYSVLKIRSNIALEFEFDEEEDEEFL